MPTRPKTHRSTQPRSDDRPSAARRGYGRRWREYRSAFLANNPLCVECETRGRLTPATDVDHTQAVSGPDDPRFWDATNHRPLCHRCHATKTARQDGGFGRGPQP